MYNNLKDLGRALNDGMVNYLYSYDKELRMPDVDEPPGDLVSGDAAAFCDLAQWGSGPTIKISIKGWEDVETDKSEHGSLLDELNEERNESPAGTDLSAEEDPTFVPEVC